MMDVWHTDNNVMLHGAEGEFYLKTLTEAELQRRLSEAESWHGSVSTGQEGVPLDCQPTIDLYSTEIKRRKGS